MNKYYTTKGIFEGDEYNFFWGPLYRLDGPAEEHANGDKFWFLNGKLHREDGPAEDYADGDKGWWINGQRHRLDGPAVECANGDKFWYLNGKLHREDGPAEDYADGTCCWYKDGKRHREDGPTIEFVNGTKSWYKDGKQHRTDGPAMEFSDGAKRYWIDDVFYSPSEFYNHPEVIGHLQLDKIILTHIIKKLIIQYKNTKSQDIFQVIQDYFLENNLLTNSTYSDIFLDVITYHKFKWNSLRKKTKQNYSD